MDKQTLIAQIIQAFAGVRLGSGIGFLEADCADDCLPADSPEHRHCRAQDERCNWHALLP